MTGRRLRKSGEVGHVGATCIAPEVDGPEQMRGMDRGEKAEFLYLTTTGRRSGLPREIEIWFTRANGRYYIIAEHGERARWMQNLLADPLVQVRVAGVTFAARARVVAAAAEQPLASAVQALSLEKYGWSDGLIVELEPSGEPAA